MEVACGQEHLDLEFVPFDIPIDATSLDLSENEIEELRVFDFEHCDNLTLIDLSYNKLQKIAPNTFDGLGNLTELRLSGNYLYFRRMSFPRNLLFRLHTLKVLKLHEQFQLSNGDAKFKDFTTIIQELPEELEVLFIDFPCEDSVLSYIKHYYDLKHLGLFRTGECPGSISNETFQSIAYMSLTSLTMKYDYLTKVEPLAFKWFPELTYLDLSDSTGISVADLYPAWFGLRETRISTLKLSSIHSNVVDPDPVVLNSTFFSQLHLPYLTHLYLDHTYIRTTFNWRLSDTFPNLVYLNLAKNRIGPTGECNTVTEFATKLKYLQELDLSHQSNANAQFLNVHLSFFMEDLDMTGFNACNRDYDMNSIFMLNQNSLAKFTFSNNCLRSLGKISVAEPNKNQPLFVNLSDNRLVAINPNLMTESISKGLKVVHLSFSGNNLGAQFANDTGETFESYRDLKILDLSDNRIETLSKSTFVHLSSLQTLNLSGNSLNWIEFEFSHMTDLRFIDLSNNKISRLNVEALDELNKIKSKHLNFNSSMIDLSGNVFECSCDTLFSLQWMLENKSNFMKLDEYYCYQKNTKVTFNNLENLLHQLETRCSPKKSILNQIPNAVGELVCILTVIPVTVFFCHKYRSHIRCCSRRGIHQVGTGTSEEETPL